MKKQIFIALALTVFVSACASRLSPILNVEAHPIVPTAQLLSLDEIKKVIAIAMSKRQWVIEEQGEGKLQGTYARNKHLAVIEVTYSKTSYSIEYKHSEALLYDGTSIHKNYNRWIANLKKDIDTNLQIAGLEK